MNLYRHILKAFFSCPVPSNSVTLEWEDIFNEYEMYQEVPSFYNEIISFSAKQQKDFEELYLAFENFFEGCKENELYNLEFTGVRNEYRSFRTIVLSYLSEYHNRSCREFLPDIQEADLSFQKLALNYTDEWTVLGWYYFWLKRLEIGDLKINWNHILTEFFHPRVVHKIFDAFSRLSDLSQFNSGLKQLKLLICDLYQIYTNLSSGNASHVNHQELLGSVKSSNYLSENLSLILNVFEVNSRGLGYLIDYDLKYADSKA
jgi:hypothetical protein